MHNAVRLNEESQQYCCTDLPNGFDHFLLFVSLLLGSPKEHDAAVKIFYPPLNIDVNLLVLNMEFLSSMKPKDQRLASSVTMPRSQRLESLL